MQTALAKNAAKRHRILVVGQTPPPWHGQAVMIASLLEGTYAHAELVHLRMAYSSQAGEVGRFVWRKVFHLIGQIIRTYHWVAVRRPAVLYYPPGGGNASGLLRDTAYLLAVRWLFEKTVFHFHAAGFLTGLERLPALLRPLARLAYRAPTCVVRVAEAAPDPGFALRAQHSVVVPNGVSDPLESGVRSSLPGMPPVLLFLGRVCEAKGVGVLLAAVAELRTAGLDFELKIAGPAESDVYADTLRQRIHALGLQGVAELCGELQGEAKWNALRGAAVLCLPTHYQEELLPVSILEGMAMGLPVVATHWRGIPELVVDGENGLLVQPHDAKGLAVALACLLEDGSLRLTMGEAGRQRFLANFTQAAYHEGMDKVFGRL